MPKSRRRKGAKKRAGGSGLHGAGTIYPAAKRRRDIALFAAVVVIAAGVGGYFLWRYLADASEFDALASEGRAALQRVESFASAPNSTVHLQPGEVHSYGEAFPTSGPHHRTPTDPGFYDESQPAIQLVHALEHGHVVIYYEEPGTEAMKHLEAWAGLFGGHWDGVVVTPKSGLGPKVVLTAWRKRLDLDPFDAAAAAAFVDAYRGRGPENPVR